MLGQDEQQHGYSEEAFTRRITAIQFGFRNKKDRRSACERVLHDHYEHLRNSDMASQEYIARSLNVLNDVLKQPELFDQKLLINYVTEIIRFVRNTGLGFEFGKAFVDRIMSVYKQAGYPLTELYLAKARFIPIDAYEHTDREKVFFGAKSYAEEIQDQEGLVRILLALTEYYAGTSQYKKSIKFCHECEQLILIDDSLLKYYPTVLTNLGINHFTLFNLQRTRQYFLRAKTLLEKELTEQRERGDQYSGKRVLGTVLHYLGRDALRRGDRQSAMAYYNEAHRYQQLGTEDLDAIAFYHLRMAELLISASLLDQARDHLKTSEELINTIVIAGTAHAQICTAWATLYEKEGNFKRAERCIEEGIEEARQKNMYRIELTCLLKLLLLEFRHIRLHSVMFVILQIINIWRGGEIERGGVLRLLKSLSILPFWISNQLCRLFIRKSLLSTCTCSMHLSNEIIEIVY